MNAVIMNGVYELCELHEFSIQKFFQIFITVFSLSSLSYIYT